MISVRILKFFFKSWYSYNVYIIKFFIVDFLHPWIIEFNQIILRYKKKDKQIVWANEK